MFAYPEYLRRVFLLPRGRRRSVGIVGNSSGDEDRAEVLAQQLKGRLDKRYSYRYYTTGGHNAAMQTDQLDSDGWE
jgi:hypothetical protein